AIAERAGVPPGRTDANGLATVPTPNAVPARVAGKLKCPARLRIVAVSEGHGAAIADAPMAPAAENGGDALFLYTDRPLYRPGHTVYWKAFARAAPGTAYRLPDATNVVLTLSGPDGASIDVANASLS